MAKTFLVFVLLALISFGISVTGRLFGATIVMGGYTDAMTMREVVIGNNVVAAPDNMIRFSEARRDGIADRLDLYMRWPSLEGYTDAGRDDFNAAQGRKTIVFLSFTMQSISRDMSGRYEVIYRTLVEPQGKSGPSGLTFHDFTAASGYLNETLAVADRKSEGPFVARCLTGKSAQDLLAPCERDVLVGDHLTMTYRFPAQLLSDWQELDKRILAKANSMIKTAKS